ncbi:heteromeric transposase endonuclease subunit TnsA [Paraburkholderia sp. CNPSo 3076]|uniref:heteromeric transposase endonuclease subunit TnsA n=1 Tax=Paraburkholderia sp. CNPSo 3076 TaxID=2940936 RepID=UPI00224DEE0E|nr:heteromeric transposase endonuclease subunit TnsA [Paraburkholderia sp. CNPSo 3076]MCX5538076.1 heteromeric transposase endonuclease subunit TnsA [Paraburkholderia sp. CNPSo 3076]
MKKRTRDMKKATRARKLKEQAEARSKGLHYRWLHTREMPGSGTRTRLACEKAALDELHLMSEAEHAEFLEGWYRSDVKLILERVALDRDKTRRAAASIGVHHPTYRDLDEAAVLSTDLVYFTERGTTHNREARSVRSRRSGPKGKLTPSQRIEQKTWENEGVPYSVVRADGMHAPRSKNLAWIFRAHNDTVGRKLSGAEITAQREMLRLVRRQKELRVVDAGRLADLTLGLPSGSGVRAFRQLAGARRLAFDLDVRDPLDLRLEEIWWPRCNEERS